MFRENSGTETTNLLLKLLSIVIFLAMAIGFGIMPYFITSCRTSTKFLGIANAFSGGLFLGIGLFHVLPESDELLKEYTEAPIAYFCAFLSYAVILFVEKIAFDSHSLVNHDHAHHDEHHHHHHSEHELENKEEEACEAEDNVEEKEREQSLTKNIEGEMAKADEHHVQKHTGITPYILLLALGFHGFFEGLALGIQSKIGGTLFLFIAIAAHKWAASLTLGISYVKAKLSKQQIIIMATIFAVIGPIGITLGLILSATSSELIEGVFLAISTGTFLYISCSEVITEEFADPRNKYVKFLMFMLGGSFIGGLALMELIDHEGGEHEH